jgi:hypothetical protein
MDKIKIILGASVLLFSSVAQAALITFGDEVDFLAATDIVSITTFDGFITPTPTGSENIQTYQYMNTAVDGVLYSTDECTNSCWSGDIGQTVGRQAGFGSNDMDWYFSPCLILMI